MAGPATRRGVLAAGASALTACALPSAPPARRSAVADPFFDDLAKRTFNFFWETTNPKNGLARDRWPTPSFSSIAAVGFALTAYPIGVERRWITRSQAADRTLTTLRFFRNAPQGPAARGMTGHKGFFYHFIDMENGERFRDSELSTVDTALLLGGVLFASGYFTGPSPAETEIRRLAEEIYGRVDWRWAQAPARLAPSINMGWKPESGHLDHSWRGFNEGMIVYLLALGSPTFPVEADAWSAWTAEYDQTWGPYFGEPHLAFGPMFGHQYSHVWVDFRGVRDAYMRGRGFDYFENSRRATIAQRNYAIANPRGWKGYSGDVWGLTACDGPADAKHLYAGEMREFRQYSARGAGGGGNFDDGTIAPTAAGGSVAFAPEIALPCLKAIHARYGQHVYGQYGFLDAFNPSFDFDDLKPAVGRRVPGFGWIGPDYLGIDQGPILAMLENHRTSLVWTVMRQNPHIRRGLQRAGFTGGWLERTAA